MAEPTVAEAMLRSLRAGGVEYLFANLGTDHPPILEAAARIRDRGDGEDIPEFVVCPHEFAAMSAAHGYAATTGNPQAVLVHVDVGTQNLGAAVHNVHRAKQPVFVLAGLAPVSDSGHQGSRSHTVHYTQDVFDQPGIVESYCRWVDEYRLPADPVAMVTRGLERASAHPNGPVYLSATREALAAEAETAGQARTLAPARPTVPDGETLDDLVERLESSRRPLIVTSTLGADGRSALAAVAERSGAGVVEHPYVERSLDRGHDHHLGYDPTDAVEAADLIVLVETDVPWVPSAGSPPAETTVVQVDRDPTKQDYPHWDFRVDRVVPADPVATLEALSERIGPGGGEGAAFWRERSERRREALDRRVDDHLAEGRLTPAVVSDALNEVVDEDTVVMEDLVTNSESLLNRLTGTTEVYSKGGSGLGWAPSAAVGAKLAHPEKRVVAPVGDGAYVFANPTACAWLAESQSAPTLTVVYNNSGWNAVKRATSREHPDGVAAGAGVVESEFAPPFDLTKPAETVGAHTAAVEDVERLPDALADAVSAVDDGRSAVLDVRIEPI